MNAYLDLANVNLAWEVKKPSPELSSINNWYIAKLHLSLFLDLDKFAQKST